MASLTLKFKKYLPFILAIILIFLYFLFFLNKGITLYDEGYIVESSYLTFLGKIPYKDFYFSYAPLTIWLGAITFKIFGAGILQLRWLALLISLLTVLAGFLVINRVAGMKIAILASISLVAWGFPQANFLWPSSLATLFLFLTLLSLIYFYQTKRKVYIGLVGLFVALTALTKPNLGLILLSASMVAVSLTGLKKIFRKKVWPFFAMFTLTLLTGASMLIYKNPDLSGFSEFIYRSSLIAKGNVLLTWYPSLTFPPPGLGQAVRWFGKTFLYYSPVIFVLYGLFAFLKHKGANVLNLAIFAITALFFFTMIWPTTDLAHFTFGVPTLIVLFAVGTKLKDRLLRKLSIVCILAFLFAGFYKTFFMSYYTFETPYLKLIYSVSVRGERIIVDEKNFVILDTLNRQKDTLFKDKSVFVYSYAPMIYFILDKIPPTRELYTVESLLSEGASSGVITDLGKNKVDAVILESWRDAHSDLTKYIRQNYKQTGNIWDFEVLNLE